METIIKHFVVAVRHDTGTAKISTAALSAEGAGQLVITAEGCPRQAIISVVEVTKKKSSNNIK